MTVLTASPAAAPAPFPATGPDLLTRAAVLLPTVSGGRSVLYGHIRSALYGAAVLLRDCQPAEAYRLADEAGDLLVAWLAEIGEVRRDEDLPVALRGWATGRRSSTVGYALRAAGEFWRAELTLAALAGTGR